MREGTAAAALSGAAVPCYEIQRCSGAAFGVACRDVIGVAGFDYEFHAIQEESNEVYLAYKEMFEVAISQGSNLKSILAIYFPIIWILFVRCTFCLIRYLMPRP